MQTKIYTLRKPTIVPTLGVAKGGTAHYLAKERHVYLCQKTEYNRRKYKQVNLRIRRDSELAALLDEAASESEYSLNFLITSALCNYFKCKLPHKQYTRTRVEDILDTEADHERC
jgi:uncharacterized protein (DUF1778 family)